MEDQNKRKRVLCPVTGKDGKTHWLKVGAAYINKDNSINVYLDCLPTNGKLQVRDWDDPPWEKRESGAAPRLVMPTPERQDDLAF